MTIKWKWISLSVACLGQLLVSVDIVVAMLSVGAFVKQLNATSSQVILSQVLFSVVAGAMQVTMGVLGLKIGYIKILRYGVILIIISEVLTFFIPNMNIVLLARIISGIGGSMVSPAAIGIILVAYKERDQEFGFSVLGGIEGLAGAVGPLLLGLIIALVGYRTSFLSLSIMGAFLLLLAFNTPPTPKVKKAGDYFDVVGAVLVAFIVVLLLVGLSLAPQIGLIHPKTNTELFGYSPVIFMLISAILLFVVFWFAEKNFELKHEYSLIPTAIMKNRGVLSGLMLFMLSFGCMGYFGYVASNYLQNALGLSSIVVGLWFFVFAMFLSTASILTPILTAKLPNSISAIIAVSIMFGGTFYLASAITETQLIIVNFLISTAFLGIAVGIMLVKAPVIIAESVPPRLAAQSSGLQTTSRNIGQAGLTAIVGMLMMVSLQNDFKASAVKNADVLGQEVVENIQNKNIDFYPDNKIENFAKEINALKSVDTLKVINSKARYVGTRNSILQTAYIIGALGILIAFLVLTRKKVS